MLNDDVMSLTIGDCLLAVFKSSKLASATSEALNTLQRTFDSSAEKVSNPYKEKYWLERSVSEYKNIDKKIK
jgi:hypothetical protein